MLFCYTRSAEELRIVGERLPPPLMMFAPPDGFSTFAPVGARSAPVSAIGWRRRRALRSPPCTRRCASPIQCLAQDKMDPFLGPGGADKEMKAAQDTCGLDRLLEIERRTMKDH